MQYLCLVYFEPHALDSLSPQEKAALDRDSLAYDAELLRRGHFVVANALQPVKSARTIRVRRGNPMATDGPFAETKEHLGGFILINADSLDQATDIAAGIPMARFGSIEVRPIMTIQPSE